MFRPEADPAVLLAWIEDEADLETIHRAARVSISSANMVTTELCVHCSAFQSTNAYSITVSQEFANEFWRAELTQVVYYTVLYCTVLYCTVLTQVVYELYPGIMESLKAINFKVSWSRVTCHASRGIMTRVYAVLLPRAAHRDGHQDGGGPQDGPRPGS